MRSLVCDTLKNTKPRNLNAVVTDGKPVLNWEAPNDAGVSGYRIFRAVESGEMEEYVDDTGSTSANYTDDHPVDGKLTYAGQALYDGYYASQESNRVQVTGLAPLTATFENMPATHDGLRMFEFYVRFSKALSNSYKVIRDHAFAVTGGVVRRCQARER